MFSAAAQSSMCGLFPMMGVSQRGAVSISAAEIAYMLEGLD